MTPLELHQTAERIADTDLEIRRALGGATPDAMLVLKLQAKLSAGLLAIAKHLADAVAP